jgi:hypothetical protein
MQEEMAAVDRDTSRYNDTGQAHDQARAALTGSVVAAVRAGARPALVAARSPFTEAYVRKLAGPDAVAAGKARRQAGADTADEMAAVDRDTSRYNDTGQAHDQARLALAGSAVAAARAGARVAVVAARSGFTESYIHKLVARAESPAQN